MCTGYWAPAFPLLSQALASWSTCGSGLDGKCKRDEAKEVEKEVEKEERGERKKAHSVRKVVRRYVGRE